LKRLKKISKRLSAIPAKSKPLHKQVIGIAKKATWNHKTWGGKKKKKPEKSKKSRTKCQPIGGQLKLRATKRASGGQKLEKGKVGKKKKKRKKTGKIRKEINCLEKKRRARPAQRHGARQQTSTNQPWGAGPDQPTKERETMSG